ncbi:hypothetical protein B0T16DRAFT_419663 [Cercophora newfieldiana]|uniref:LysM domain-containing protein n=1 Tax=Cercophora newfieldiana TaxID=92897 RepID=A0AA40CL00_9PEZI|nr:hypothetical protein B0T16DRAFT_419663 [Cercophora newfieldiana]
MPQHFDSIPASISSSSFLRLAQSLVHIKMSSFKRCGLLVGLVAARTALAGSKPSYPYDPSTATNCVWWYDNNGFDSCDSIASSNWLSVDGLRAMNPSLGPDCAGIKVSQSYCVETNGEPQIPGVPSTASTGTTATPTPTPSKTATSTTFTTSTKSSTIITPTPSPTKPSNGIQTPEQTQGGMVDNCDAFYFVKQGENCETVLSKNGITLAQLYAWNPSVGSTCNGLWAEVNVCVSIIGHTPSTTTTTGNGIATPTPVQPGMVSNCDAFYFVPKGETCETVLSKNSITIAQLYAWNPSVGSNCAGLWAEVNVCVSIVGHTPTAPGNGIQTPTPFQPGMVTNCKTFHFVDGQTCQNIFDKYKITLANFVKWNPQVGNNCQSMWNKTYVCVGVL